MIASGKTFFGRGCLIPLAWAIFALCSCGADAPGSAETELTLTMPEWPPTHPALEGWRVVFYDHAGPNVRQTGPRTRELTVTLDKNQCAPVLCWALVSAPADDSGDEGPLPFFLPAGCVYPASSTPAWEEGFAAQLCYDLLANGAGDYTPRERRAYCNRFNWRRLNTEIAALVAAKDGATPWQLDRQRILAAVLAGKFTKASLKLAAATVTLDLPESAAGTPYLWQTYVPAPSLECADGTVAFPYRSGTTENLLLDESRGRVYLVAAAGKGAYRLAIFPQPRYTARR
jgi:hypothetical protein